MFEKIVVKGPGRHPLYDTLTHAQAKAGVNAKTGSAGPARVASAPDEVAWNFEKFVVGRHGDVVARHGDVVARHGDVVARLMPTVAPDDPDLTAIVEAELAKA